MYDALLRKDSSYEGIFFAAVKTTKIFCRPRCTARKPKRENVEFYRSAREALLNGYHPCKICKPLEPLGKTPEHIQELLQQISEKPLVRITDNDLLDRHIEPNTVRRWFKANHGMTFQGYQRMIRINNAFRQLADGNKVSDAAFDNGYDSLSGFTETFKNIIGKNPSLTKTAAIINIHRFTSPLGPMIACATHEGICMVEFADRRMLESELKALKHLLKANIVAGDNEHFHTLGTQLEEYFCGKRKWFDLPLVTPGTEFQRRAWQALIRIPYGETRSYKQQATAIHNIKAVRAVARANGSNRISIIIPCHRVIGDDGNLTGYGGGLWRKKWLLDLEKRTLQNTQKV